MGADAGAGDAARAFSARPGGAAVATSGREGGVAATTSGRGGNIAALFSGREGGGIVAVSTRGCSAGGRASDAARAGGFGAGAVPEDIAQAPIPMAPARHAPRPIHKGFLDRLANGKSSAASAACGGCHSAAGGTQGDGGAERRPGITSVDLN
jgi:hypothetical protein